MKRIKKIIGIVLCITLFTTLVNIPNQYVYATQNKTYNYSKGYSIQGNGADDIVNVAMAQVGKTGAQLGYSEQWCADFVSDCADLAGQGSAIPRNGYCPSLQNAIINAGGYNVSVNTARKGDIAFTVLMVQIMLKQYMQIMGDELAPSEEIREVVEIVIPDRFAIILIKR